MKSLQHNTTKYQDIETTTRHLKIYQGYIILQVTKKLFGITSWGMDCAKGVGIYSRVGFYQHWINKMINAEETPKDDYSVEYQTNEHDYYPSYNNYYLQKDYGKVKKTTV